MTEQNTGWRDISTAPKDGTTIRAYFPGWVNGDKQNGCPAPGQIETYWFGCVDHGTWITPGRSSSDDRHPTHWQPLPPPPGEEVESDEVVFDDGFNPFMDGYDVDPDGPQNQVPPFRASDIERGLILLRTSSNAHGYTNCVVLTDRIEKLPAKGRQELARMMRNIATEIDGPSPLQARCDKLEDAASTLLAHLVAAVSVIKTSEENGNHPSCAYGSDTMYRMAMKDFDRCMEAGRDALRSVVDGGE